MQTITRKSLLYKTAVGGADYCLNHIEGCSHGCRFPCYAYMMKKSFGKIKDYSDWCRPKIVSNALELLNREIPKYKGKIKYVHLCFSTDPFMYKQDEVIDLSLQIIDKLNKNHIPCSILTKGILPEELAGRNGTGQENEYGITLISLDENFRQEYEPNTAPYQERIKSLERLHNNGFKTWVSLEPYPTPNIIKQDLYRILEVISFVDRIYFGRWNYNSQISNFRHRREFYDSMSSAVIKFCKKNRIDYHIKGGMATTDSH